MAEFRRFMGVGLFNTALGYALYAFFHLFLSFTQAYTVSVAIGIVVSYMLNTKMVFRSRISFRTGILFPVVCFVQYLLGVCSLRWLVEQGGIHDLLAPLLVLGLTVPFGFFGYRYALRG
ncbi:GtrA family protein [Enterovibrio norvegicus]|uniref:GtrA/DPMS transmembrane domain-containing protein n=1 Tax=Enterovibrio norvegicus TaxID=188144 RepID=A0A2N7L8Q2_9GAMM|nr:GtrA family protein [Enterovibrio norvegicus]PMN90594.1 hypothetical protein BCT23_19445 [Enterovibrio norvegicus]